MRWTVSALLAAVMWVPLASAEEVLYFFSESGDYIGQGQEQSWTVVQGSFSASRNFDNGVSIDFNGNDPGLWWNLEFAAAQDAELQPGSYENATRFPFQETDVPGLNVSGSGRGCNQLIGRFDILEVSYGPAGEVQQFAADFEQHCEEGDAALFGSIRLDSDLAVTTGKEELYLDSDPGDYVGQGLVRSITPDDAAFQGSQNFDNGASVSISGATTWWNLDFAAPFATLLNRGAYENASRFPFQADADPGLSVTGEGRGCNQLNGRFDVLEVQFGSGDELERFAADFEQYCDGSDSALRGAIRLNSFEDIQDGHTLLYFDSEPGDYIGQGVEQTWRRSTGRFNATRNFDSGVSIKYQDDSAGTWWDLDFAAADDVPLIVGVYAGAERFPFQGAGQPGLSVSGSGRGCNQLSGQFEVLEVIYTAQGRVERFAADFEQQCDASSGLLRGAVRYNSTVPFTPDAEPPLPSALTPWQDSASGTNVVNVNWPYAMGYHFTPQVDGQVSALGGFFNGTKTVRLFDFVTGTLLAEAQVTAANEWNYTDIDPVAVQAGHPYTVAVYLAGSGGSYRYGVDDYPISVGGIQIDATTWIYTGSEPDARPVYSYSNYYMFGQADIRFVSAL